ncbi:MAG: hypothetical protein HYT42_01705 [Candidatus Sungbacteria bacterium]|nr:hypothetical protein [Candidatus Sungbacteria bacterium]
MANEVACSLASNPSIIEYAVTCGSATVGLGSTKFDALAHILVCRSCAEKVVHHFKTLEPRRFRQVELLGAACECLGEVAGS